MHRDWFVPSFRRNAAITLRALEVRPVKSQRNQLNCCMICRYHIEKEVKKSSFFEAIFQQQSGLAIARHREQQKLT